MSMQVIRPTNNPITGKYSTNHRGYDFAGLNLPDELRAGKDGTVIQVVNKYDKNWTATKPLTTEDYGNYILIKHTDGTYELHAHLKKDSMLPVGTKVKAGQLIARIGNTGNSSGPHVHSEFRNAQNQNIEVEFITMEQTADNITRKSSFFDVLWQGVHGQTDTDKITREQVDKRVIEAKSEKYRGGQFDQLARKAGYTGDTNILTFEKLYQLIVDKELQEYKKTIQTLIAENKAIRQKTLEEVMQLINDFKT